MTPGDVIYCLGFVLFQLGDSSRFTTGSDTFQKQQQHGSLWSPNKKEKPPRGSRVASDTQQAGVTAATGFRTTLRLFWAPDQQNTQKLQRPFSLQVLLKVNPPGYKRWLSLINAPLVSV